MGEFLEFTAIPLQAEENYSDIITAYLSEYPFDVFDTENGSLKAYGIASKFPGPLVAEIMELVTPFVAETPSTRLIPKENWNELWETHYFEPIEVDNRVRVRALFQTPKPSMEMDLIVQPKMSFGTGHHSTTQLVISLMLQNEADFAGATVLDMGAGTGILAIVAEKLGAENIDAIDIEEWAAENIDENAQLNNCQHIHSFHGDADSLKNIEQTFSIILANIHKQVLLADAEKYLEKLTNNGSIYLSGFYLDDLKGIEDKYSKLGCKLMTHRTKLDWCAAHFLKTV